MLRTSNTKPVLLRIQIVNYNSKEHLIRCLQSVQNDLQGAAITHEILILDNKSNDDLSDLKQLHSGSNVFFYKAKANKGFGAGHNELFKMHSNTAEFTLILNPDTVLTQKHTIKTLLDYINQADTIAVVGPELYNTTGHQKWDHGEVEGILAKLKNSVGYSHAKKRSTATNVAWVAAAVFLIRSEVFSQVNLFDEAFFMYSEELDLCQRVRTAGYKIVYVPDVQVFHVAGASGGNRLKLIAPSVRYYNKKHLGPIRALLLNPLYTLCFAIGRFMQQKN